MRALPSTHAPARKITLAALVLLVLSASSAARALDLSGLGAWSGVLFLAVGGLNRPAILAVAAVLVLPTLLLPWTMRVVDSTALRCLATRGLRGRRWARRIRRIRREIDALRTRPSRLWAAVGATFVMWGLQWTVAWVLLQAMGYDWQPATGLGSSWSSEYFHQVTGLECIAGIEGRRSTVCPSIPLAATIFFASGAPLKIALQFVSCPQSRRSKRGKW